MRRPLTFLGVAFGLVILLACGEALPEFRASTWDYGDGIATLDLPLTARFIERDEADGVSVLYGNVLRVKDAGGLLRLLDPAISQNAYATRVENIEDNAKWFKDVKTWDGKIAGHSAEFVRATWLPSDSEDPDFIFDEVELSAFVAVNDQVWRITCYSPADEGLQQRICDHIVDSLQIE